MAITALQRALAAACLCALGAAALPAAAQPKPLTLRYTTGAPAKTPWVMQLERFAKDVEEESKGSIKIDQFIAAQLGNEQDTAQQVARGRIDMGGFSSGAVALLVPDEKPPNRIALWTPHWSPNSFRTRWPRRESSSWAGPRWAPWTSWARGRSPRPKR